MINMSWLSKIVLSDRTQHLSNKYSLPIKEIKNLLQYDPTKGRYLEWIVKNHKSNKLRFPEDGPKTIETLTIFTQLHPVLKRNNVPIDINLYSYSDLVRLIEQHGGQKSKREQHRINEVEGVKELLDFPPYKAVQILTPEASAKLCRSTQWCVKDPAFFEGYSDNLIMVLKNGEPYYLVHEGSGQYKNRYDEPLLDKKYDTEALGVLVNLYNSSIVKEPAGDDFGYGIINSLSVDQVSNSAKLSCHYARDVLNGRFELGEAAIATDAISSYNYARYALKNRFKLGETAIAKEAYYSYLYARYVLNGKFELGEAAIATSAKWSYEYAYYFLKDRFERGEAAIATDAFYSYAYAKDIIKGRFTLGEAAIATNASTSFKYAKFILKERFNLAEPVIAEDPQYSYLYAELFKIKRYNYEQ